MEKHKENEQWIYTWQCGASTFKAMPEAGARLMSWDINAGGNSRSVIYWNPKQEDWAKIANIRGGNPILFPFVARTFDAGQIGFWRTPQGERRPMVNHGYARQGKFAIESADAQGFITRFLPDEACQEAYPYAYTFTVRYTFSELALRVTLELTNEDTRPIPWCAGHHFYFTLPWHAGSRREDYTVNIPARKAWVHTSEGKLHPVKGFETITPFSEPTLSDRIHTHLKSHCVRFGPRSGEEDICIRIGTDPVPPTHGALVTWTQAEDSPFYCVEPWMGAPNSPEHKKGLHFVNPGAAESFEVEVSLG